LLVYKSQIILNVLCNFTLSGDSVKITKYTAGNIGKECPPDSLNLKKDKVKFFCSKCEMESTIDNACFKCDNCGGYFTMNHMTRIGLTLVICSDCSKKEPAYKEFTAVLPKFDSKKLKVDEKSLENAIAEIPGVIEYPPLPIGYEGNFRILRNLDEVAEQLRAAPRVPPGRRG